MHLLSRHLQIIGNAIAGAFVVSASYSYQFGALGKNSMERFKKKLSAYEKRKASEGTAEAASEVKVVFTPLTA
jgi:hypothetical protein